MFFYSLIIIILKKLLSMVVYAHNPSTQKAKTFQGQSYISKTIFDKRK